MGLYEDIIAVDVIDRVKHHWKPNGHFYIPYLLENDPKYGKITFKKEVRVVGYPWVHVKNAQGMRDDINFDLLFRYFKDDLGAPPIRCQSCWKVVVRPRTVVELFALFRLMKLELNDKVYGCKLGLEDRPTVNALYGGYFYCRNLQEGHDTYKLVSEYVGKYINKDIKVFLKRGCTEMEVYYGDPDKWEVKENQEKMESWILSKFDIPERDLAVQPPVAQESIKRNWVEVACAYGDLSYKHLTENPLHIEYKHYELRREQEKKKKKKKK